RRSSHAIASRYGRITLATRQILAYFQRSSILHLRLRRHSRSASIATSRPILLRYLKQSATVFAGQYSLTVTPSILWVSTPEENAASENLITRSWGVSTRGRAAFRSSAIQTSKGLCVPMSWKRSAESRQIIPRGTFLATSAREKLAEMLAFGSM